MIGALCGKIIDKNHPGYILLDVQGVGYEVETSLTTFVQLELSCGMVQMYIHTIIREDAFLLYGFLEKQERALFRSLIKVNGVGPKLAIAILSHSTPVEFMQLIQQKNTALLIKLPGVGKKTAERLVIEMADKLAQFTEVTACKAPPATDEALSALMALGYKRQEAINALKLCEENASTEQLIRQALQKLA